MKPRLLERYHNEIAPAMVEKFGYKNKMQVPRLQKIVINMGIGAGALEPKLVEDAKNELAMMTGQRPVATQAKKAISNFKIRKGSLIGCVVTLRRYYMYEFLDRFINMALPRIRDFRGVSPTSFDKAGNYSLGIKEHTIFPELDMDKITKVKGMTVTVGIGKSNPEESYELLRLFGMPFAKNKMES